MSELRVRHESILLFANSTMQFLQKVLCCAENTLIVNVAILI